MVLLTALDFLLVEANQWVHIMKLGDSVYLSIAAASQAKWRLNGSHLEIVVFTREYMYLYRIS